MAGVPNGVPDGGRVLGMAEYFVAKLTRKASPRDDERNAVKINDPGNGEAEPLELVDCRLCRRRPDHLLKDVPACRALDGNVVKLVRRRLHPDIELHFFGLFAEPFTAEVAAADPAEIVGTEPVKCSVVDHRPSVVAHSRIDALTDS